MNDLHQSMHDQFGTFLCIETIFVVIPDSYLFQIPLIFILVMFACFSVLRSTLLI